MRQFHVKKSAIACPTVNVDKLWSFVPESVFERAKNSDGSNVPVLDVTRLGYFKVLGKGNLPAVPLVVKARYFSLDAEKKIKAAGGACLLSA